jgi:LysM repeat protein
MRARTWGLIAIIALVLAAVLLGITLIGQRGSEAGPSATPTPTNETIIHSPSPSPFVTPTPAEPVTYTVQAGDTLSGIAEEHGVSLEALIAVNDLADPDVLSIGQTLIIPSEDSDAVSSPAPGETSDQAPEAGSGTVASPPTLTPSGPSLVEIGETMGIGDLEAEVIVLTNEGGTVNLEGWTLSSPDGGSFTFPPLTLFPDGTVWVHSTAGDDTARDLHWGRAEPAWREGELVTLRDGDGNVVDTYIVPE